MNYGRSRDGLMFISERLRKWPLKPAPADRFRRLIRGQLFCFCLAILRFGSGSELSHRSRHLMLAVMDVTFSRGDPDHIHHASRTLQ